MDQTLSILIVDDEPTGRQLLEAVLYTEGYNLLFAENGEEALKLTIENLPAIVLLDVMMPKMDGFEVCRKLRQNEDTAHIAVFLITALDDRDSRIKGIDAGADDYISKPYDRIEILAKIKNRAFLDKFRLKSQPEANNQKNTTHKVNDHPLLDCTIKHLLSFENSKNYAQVDIFRTSQIYQSKYAFINLPKSEGKAFVMISNKADSNKAALVNVLLGCIMNKEIDNSGKSPSNLIQLTLERITQIASESNLQSLIDTSYSIIIGYQDTISGNYIVSGLNQTIFFLHKTESEETKVNNPVFQSLYLMGSQDNELKDLNELVMFSENIQEIFSHPDLTTFLNSNIKSGKLLPLAQIMPTKFNLNDDILGVKLSF